MKKEKIKTVSLDTMIDKHIGKKGTAKRDAFDNELRMDLLGEAIKETRKAKNLTQEQLGAMMGVQKAQISKIDVKISRKLVFSFLKPDLIKFQPLIPICFIVIPPRIEYRWQESTLLMPPNCAF